MSVGVKDEERSENDADNGNGNDAERQAGGGAVRVGSIDQISTEAVSLLGSVIAWTLICSAEIE